MPGISAAEKYAELEARGEERPKCKCHGQEKKWNSDKRRRSGGYWSHVANPEKVREWQRRADQKRAADPDFRRRRTLYKLEWDYRRKHERWADQGLTLGNDGEEGSAGGDRAAA